ncbi:MAG: RluA family pseudouridine synthase [Planctomycetota bacterium]
MSGAAADGGLLDPGGKVDQDALRAAVERAGPDDPDARRVVLTLQRDINDRLDRYLTSRIPFMSRSQIQRLIEDGHAVVNGRTARASTKLRGGDAIDLVLPPPPSGEIEPEDIPLDVLFEDAHIIVLNKRAGIIVHPARSHNRGTMLNALAWRFRGQGGGALSPVGTEFARPGVVHRLDRDTTGCIAFAKTEEAHWKLAAQFEKRTTDKRYLAIVHGRVESAVEVIEAPIGPHPSREKGYREKMVVRHDQLGKPSVTICRVREVYRLHDRPVGDQWFSLVELELKTGRTHQIRVHLSDRGWPIVGDDMYGGRAFELPGGDATEAGTIDRQMLHAALLAFEHPITGKTMAPVAPIPGDMNRLLAHLRSGMVERVNPAHAVPYARLDLEEGE